MPDDGIEIGEVPLREEQRHEPGDDELWNESWYFDFVAADGSLGGYVRLGLYPNLGVSWYWAYLVRPGRDLLVVRNHEAPLPKGGALEIRDEGLWSNLVCETPHEHWTIGLEAFAVRLDEPPPIGEDERGDLVPLGFDLEWEADARPFPYPGASRYEQACTVHGEVLVGDERVELTGYGERDHSWGVRDWWRFGWCWTAGHLDDGSAFHAMRPMIPDVRFQPAFTVVDGTLRAAEGFAVDTTYGADGLPERSTMTIGPSELVVTVVGQAPVSMAAPDGRVGRLARAMCRFEGAARSGFGWTEWNQPEGKPV